MTAFQEIGDGIEQNINVEKNRGKDESSLPGWQSVAVLFLPEESYERCDFNNYDFIIKLVSW